MESASVSYCTHNIITPSFVIYKGDGAYRQAKPVSMLKSSQTVVFINSGTLYWTRFGHISALQISAGVEAVHRIECTAGRDGPSQLSYQANFQRQC